MKPALPVLALVLVLNLAFSSQTHAQDATFYLLRHAEKVTTNIDDTDPGLTQEGYRRAKWMTDFLENKGITRIFSSDFKRTRETVAELSERLEIPLELYDPRALPEEAKRFKTMEGVIVIVGHSNTTPELASLLSNQKTEPMPESEYDRFYEIRFDESGDIALFIHRSHLSDRQF